MMTLRNRLLRRPPAPGPSYLSGVRVTPTTDSGGATYSAGSRLFLPTPTSSNLVFTTGLPAGLTAAGTIAFRVTPTYALNDSVAHNWSPLITFANGYVYSLKGGTNIAYARLNDGGNHNTGSVAVTGAAGTSVYVVIRYTDAATIDCNINGTDLTQTVVDATLGALGALYIQGNCYLTGATAADSVYVGPVLVSPSRKSDAWVTSLQANRVANFNPNVLYRSFMASTDFLAPLKDNGMGYVKR